MSKDTVTNNIVNVLVTNMLAMSLDDVTIMGDLEYYRAAVEAFDALDDDQRARARRVYQWLLAKNTHFASGAPISDNEMQSLSSTWINDDDTSGGFDVTPF